MLLEVLQVFTGVFVVVYDGQHALKYTLGRARLVVGPGIHFKWPIVQRFRVQDTKHTTLDLEPQVIQLQDDLVYDVGAKVVYQVVDLRKALIEVDDLVEGLKNRLTLAVQRVVKAQTRESIRDLPAMITAVKEELRPVEEQWGIRIREFGFSNLSPTPPTLEITQLRLLAEEKLGLYHRFTRAEGLTEDAAVALISGAVMAVREGEREPRERPAPPPPPTAPEVGDAELAPVA
ncbi:MAG: SPFH domain-containing protein [Planctomycetes bacterium]|nr:SPFH domain-containing protein [Planctomycetota bacterium]